MRAEVRYWDDEEQVFAEPWQGRVAALARAWVAEAGDRAFRSGLSGMLAESPSAPYFESVVGALEGAAIGSGRVTEAELELARLTSATYAVVDAEHGAIQVLSLEVDGGNEAWAAPLLGLVDWRRLGFLEAYWGVSRRRPSPACGLSTARSALSPTSASSAASWSGCSRACCSAGRRRSARTRRVGAP